MGATLGLVLMGAAGSGKDTFADILAKNFLVLRYAHSDPLYEIARNYFGMQKKDRELLIKIGNKLREIDKDVLIKSIERRIIDECDGVNTFPLPSLADVLANGLKRIVIVTDCRFPDEYNVWVKQHGFYPVKIEASEAVRLARLKRRDGYSQVDVLKDKSESHYNEMPAYVLTNNGNNLQDFSKRVHQAVFDLLSYDPFIPSKWGMDISLTQWIDRDGLHKAVPIPIPQAVKPDVEIYKAEFD